MCIFIYVYTNIKNNAKNIFKIFFTVCFFFFSFLVKNRRLPYFKYNSANISEIQNGSGVFYIHFEMLKLRFIFMFQKTTTMNLKSFLPCMERRDAEGLGIV